MKTAEYICIQHLIVIVSITITSCNVKYALTTLCASQNRIFFLVLYFILFKKCLVLRVPTISPKDSYAHVIGQNISILIFTNLVISSVTYTKLAN